MNEDNKSYIYCWSFFFIFVHIAFVSLVIKKHSVSSYFVYLYVFFYSMLCLSSFLIFIVRVLSRDFILSVFVTSMLGGFFSFLSYLVCDYFLMESPKTASVDFYFIMSNSIFMGWFYYPVAIIAIKLFK